MRSKSQYRLLVGVATASCVAVIGLLACPAPVRAAEGGEALALSVSAGEVRDFTVRLGDGGLPALRAELVELRDLPEDLRLGFAAPATPQPNRWPEEELPDSTVVEAGQPLHLRGMARRCTGAGSYRVPLRLTSPSSLDGHPMEFPIRLEVKPASPCGSIYVGTVAAALGGLLVGLLPFCLWSMCRRSRWLRPEALSKKVCPLSWRETGVPEPNLRGVKTSASRILCGIAWQRRLSAWLTSWWRRLRKRPWLALGGGEPYEERVRIYLGLRPDAVALQPVPEGDLAASERGALYVVAQNSAGIRFVAAPTPEGIVEGMELERAPSGVGREVNLSGRTQLLIPESFEEDPTGPAGWRIG